MSVSSISAQSASDSAKRPEALGVPEAYIRLRWQLAAGALLVALICTWLSPVPTSSWLDIVILTSLTVVVSLLPVRLPGSHLFTVPTIPILFSLVGLCGASAAILAALVSTVANGYMSMSRSRRAKIISYVPNVSTQIIAIGGSALLYVLVENSCFPHNGVRMDETPEWRAWLALPLCALIAFIISGLLTTTLVSFYHQQRWDLIWHDNIRWMLPSALIMSPLGFLTAVLYGQNHHWWLAVGFILLPIYALRMMVIAHERTMEAYKQGVDLLGRIMQEAHPYTHGHLHRVARWAKKIAEEMKLPASSMQHIEDAAILHDIGKVAVDDRVLNKVGKLSDDDWAMIRRHPVTGANLVIQMSVLDKVGHWIRHHHERPDGKGYPDGLQGDAIPIESSIISVVDAFDAMVGGPAKEDQRPYRKPMTQEAAIEELRRHAGTQFHAEVVEVFIRILGRETEMEAKGQNLTTNAELADDSLWGSPPEMSGTLFLSPRS